MTISFPDKKTLSRCLRQHPLNHTESKISEPLNHQLLSIFANKTISSSKSLYLEVDQSLKSQNITFDPEATAATQTIRLTQMLFSCKK